MSSQKMAQQHEDIMVTLQQRESTCLCWYGITDESTQEYCKIRPEFVAFIDGLTATNPVDQEMVHATFAIMDAFFSRCGSAPPNIDAARPFLCAAVLIACKMLLNMVGVLDALCSAAKMKPDVVRSAEIVVLNALAWNVNFTTTHEFLVAYNTAGMFHPNDIVFVREKAYPVTPNVRRRVCEFVRFFADRSVREAGTMRFATSILSAAAWCMARRMCGLFPEWGPQQEHVTWRAFVELRECVQSMHDSCSSADVGAGAADLLTDMPPLAQQQARSAHSVRPARRRWP